MTWDLSDQEKQGVRSAPDDKQYSYFVDKTSDWGEAWALSKGGEGESWASLEDKGTRCFPVWAHEGYVRDAMDLWPEHEPTPVEIHSFLAHLGDLDDMGDEVAVMRDPEGTYLVVPPSELKADLEAALKRLE